MPLETDGVRLVVEGYSKFVADMGSAIKTISDFGTMTKNRLAAIQSMNDAVTKMTHSMSILAITQQKTIAANGRYSQEAAKLSRSQTQAMIATERRVTAERNAALMVERLRVAENNLRVAREKATRYGLSAQEETKETTSAMKEMLSAQEKVIASTGRLEEAQLREAEAALKMSEANQRAARESSAAMEKSIGSITGSIGGILGGIGGGGGFGAGSGIGGAIGGLAGILFPTIGEEPILAAIGAMVGGIIGGIGNLTVKLGKSVGSIFTAIVKGITGSIGGALKAIGNAGASIVNAFLGIFGFGGGGTGGWRSLGGSIFSAMFKFEILKQSIRKVIEVIKDFGKSAVKAGEDVQYMTVRIDNLISRQVRALGITDQYAESINIASGYTENLRIWMAKLALATPVGIDAITNVTTLSMAMGWGVESAKDLTESMVDYVAATGLGNEVMERIIYNFAQMKTQGKVTGTELRDLGRGAFLPINDILRQMADNLGISASQFEQFREDVSQGKVDVEEFFKAFEDWVAKGMPGVAKSMNWTIRAIIDDIKDMFNIFLGWNIIAPALQQVFEPIREFMEGINFEEMQNKTVALGKAITWVIKLVQDAIKGLMDRISIFFQILGMSAPTIESTVKQILKFGMAVVAVIDYLSQLIVSIFPFAKQMREKVGQPFEDMSNDFFTYAFKMMVNFAKGMVKGATTAIVAAIKFVTNLLTNWFSPGSPPKVAPDIDKWGAQAMAEFLRGFTEVDYDVLDSIQDSLGDALQSLVDLGQLDELVAGEMFIKISKSLIKSIDKFNDTGNIGSKIFEQLKQVGGGFGKELALLLEKQVALAKAIDLAAIAQERWNEAVAKTKTATSTVNKLIREYNKMLRAGSPKEMLRSRLKQINLAEDDLKLAREQEKQAEANKEAADAAIDPLEKAVSLQERLIEQLTELARKQAELMKARDTGGGAGGAQEDPLKEWEDFTEGLGETGIGFPEIDFGALLKEAQDEFDTLFKETLPAIWDDAWGQMVLDISPHLVSLKAAWDKFAASVKLPSWDEIASAWKGVGKTETKWVEDESGALVKKTVTTSTNTFMDSLTSVLSLFAEDIKTNGGILSILGNIAGNLMDNISAKINTEENRKKVKDALTGVFTDIGEILADIVLGKQAPSFQITPEGQAQTSEISRQSGWQRLGDELKILMGEIGRVAGQALLDGIVAGISALIVATGPGELDEELAVSTMSNDNLIENFRSWGLGIGNNIVEGITGGISEKAATIDWAAIGQTIIDLFSWNWFGAKSPAEKLIPLGVSIVEGMVLGITEQLGTIDIPGMFSVITDSIKEFFGISEDDGESERFFEFGVAMIDGMKTGFTTTIEILFGKDGVISSAIDDFIENVRKEFGVDETTDTGNPFINLGKSIMEGIKTGLERFKGAILQTVNDLGLEIPAWLAKLLQVGSPAKVMIPIGKSIVDGIRVGITKSANGLRSTVEGLGSETVGMFSSVSAGRYSGAAARGSLSPVVQAQPVMSSNSVNFGNVYINDKMDWATFKNQVHRAVLEG